MKSISQLQLSQEELIFLLRSLQLPDLNGMGRQPWIGIPQDHAFDVMMETGRSLLDRDIQKIENEELIIDPDVRALLEACAYPEKMVILNFKLNDHIGEIDYYQFSNRFIKHTSPSPRVHLFEIMDVSDMGLSILKSLFESWHFNKSSSVITFKHEELNQVKELAHESVLSATEKLLEYGMEAEAAERLSMVFANSTLKIRLQVYYDLQEPTQQIVLSFFVRSESCWMVTGGIAGTNALQVKEVTSGELNKVIQSLFNPFSDKTSIKGL